MSISDAMTYYVGCGRLSLLSPVMPGAMIHRKLYVVPTIRDILTGPWENAEWESRCGMLRADLDRFIEGDIIPVAQPPSEGKTSFLKQLRPTRDECWEIRSRDPSPAIRVFGRFAAKDVFIAMGWAKRPDLGPLDSRGWRDAKEACNAEWRKLFPAYPPHSGANSHDYVSKIILV